MSTSLLYHAWGVRGYSHVRTSYQEGRICFVIEQAPQTFRCAHCGSRQVEKAGQVVRCFHCLPVGEHRAARPAALLLQVRQDAAGPRGLRR